MDKFEIEDLRREVKSKVFTKKAGDGKTWVCPICESGSGKNGTGVVTSNDTGTERYTCFAGRCFPDGSDIFTVIGNKYHCEKDFPAQLQKACELTGREFNSNSSYKAINKPTTASPVVGKSNYTTEVNKQPTGPVKKEEKSSAQKEEDFMPLYRQCCANINQTDYHRGLSDETLKRFLIGFAPKGTLPADSGASGWDGLVIPTSKSSYAVRNINTGSPDRYRKVGSACCFNLKALYTATEPVFVSEGEIDSLSVEDCGFPCCGLGSTSGRKKLISEIQDRKEKGQLPTQPLILLSDNDTAGIKAMTELKAELDRINIPCYLLDDLQYFYGNAKDCNELLNTDREGLKARLVGVRERALAYISQQKYEQVAEQERLKEEYRKTSCAGRYQEIRRQISETSNVVYPSEWESLNKLLDGGFTPGLTCIGAVSNIGKTTFALNIAETVARSGTDVLFFSLEQDTKTLVAKLVSRLSARVCKNTYSNYKKALSTTDVLKERTNEFLEPSWNEFFRNVAPHLYICEPDEERTIQEITNRVNLHINRTDAKPFVVIDYLQNIDSDSDFDTERKKIDKVIRALRKLVSKVSVPIVLISSLGRAAYNKGVSTDSFKESGGIEYGSDVLFGLQYKGMEALTKENEEEAKRIKKEAEEKAINGKPQEIQICILKNRLGVKSSITLNFYPTYNHYVEPSADIPANAYIN